MDWNENFPILMDLGFIQISELTSFGVNHKSINELFMAINSRNHECECETLYFMMSIIFFS